MRYNLYYMNTINTFLSVPQSSFTAYFLIFLLALIESLPLVGIILPGSMILMALGFAAASGFINPFYLYILFFLGSIIGDTLGFTAGRKGLSLFRKDNSLIVRGKDFMNRHGAKSIFLGRFIGPIRPILSLVAGTLELPTYKFYAWNILATAIWLTLYEGLGFYFGQAWQFIAVWSTRVSIVLAAILGFIIIWWFIKRFVYQFGQSIARVLFSFAKSIKHAFLINEYVRKFANRYPAIWQWTKARLSRTKFTGLPLTLLVIGFLYILSIFSGLVEDVIKSEAIVSIDIRVENLLFVFRHESITQLFLWITALGKSTVWIFGAVIVSIILWLMHKHRQMLGYWIAVIGSALSAVIGKYLVHRLRPSGVGVYTEDSFSFPSGHATMSTVFYGFLIYLYLLSGKSWRQKINAFFGGSLIIILIGFSRLYLGVHYLSDVLGGISLGLLWLIIGITCIEWMIRANVKLPVPASKVDQPKKIIIVLAALWFIFAAYSVIEFEPIRLTPELPSQVTITSPDILTIFSQYNLTKYTEKLDGSPQEPLSFIIAAKNDQALIDAFSKAGWYQADQINLNTAGSMLLRAIQNQDYSRAPMTPSFWNAHVHDLGFEKATQEQTVRQRHHARFWNTGLHTPDGKNIYVGTASLDIGLKWFFAHRIAPAIDTERELMFSDLNSNNTILNWRREQFVDPTLGTNAAQDPFFTDGKIYIIEL